MLWKWRSFVFFLSDFPWHAGPGIIYYLGFSPCLQARTTFKPIQTLQILKITLCLPLPGLAEAFFKQEIRLFLPARLLLNSPRDLVVLFQTTRWQGHCIVRVCVCVCVCVVRWGSSWKSTVFSFHCQRSWCSVWKVNFLKGKTIIMALCEQSFLLWAHLPLFVVVQLLSWVRLFVTPWTLLLFLKVIPVLPEVKVTMTVLKNNL